MGYTEMLLSDLMVRKQKNDGITRVENHKLPAGSPMYVYCRACGEEMMYPEDALYLNHLCGACDVVRTNLMVDPIVMAQGGTFAEGMRAYRGQKKG